MYKKLFCLMVCFMGSSSAATSVIKLYALYTPSHEVFLKDWFLPSIKDDYEIVLDQVSEQLCPSGSFMSAGWRDVMIKKIELVIRAIKENPNRIFIHSDVDIQFLRPSRRMIVRLMKDNDLLIQQDDPAGNLCAGFFVCRGNVKTLRLFERINDELRAVDQKVQDKTLLPSELKALQGLNDQRLLNQLIKQSNPYKIKWNLLPVSFSGGGTLTGKLWHPGRALPIPQDIILHHANWTRGISNKIEQLRYVKQYFDTYISGSRK